MTGIDQSSEAFLGKYIGPTISGAILAIITWLTAGSTGAINPLLAALLSVLVGVVGLVSRPMYQHYVGIISSGGNRKGSPERQAYEQLRHHLMGNNVAARMYSRSLTRFLDGFDRFFGDADIPSQTLFPHVFGLKKPAALWTVPSFERCLLLALFYPIATIFIIWAISGHFGPAEFALHLDPRLHTWEKCVSAGLVGISAISLWRAMRTTGRKRLSWTAVCIFLFVFAIAWSVAKGPPGNVWGNTKVGPLMHDGSSVTQAFTLYAVDKVSVASAFMGLAIAVVIIGVIGSALVVLRRLNQGTGYRWEVFSLCLLILMMIITCFAAARWLSALDLWKSLGPLLLFLGLLTLLNAPFDWLSLGLTRALLRRGLELGGWWPFVLAIVDLTLAAVIVVILAIVMVIGVQIFDNFTIQGGGKPVLPLDQLFNGTASREAPPNGISSNPTAPEYWWVYALLLSSMVPRSCGRI